MVSITDSIVIEAPLSAVYAALTTEDGVRGWWNRRARISPDVGGTSTYRFSKGGADVDMTFSNTALDPAGRVAWHCEANDNASWIGTDVSWSLRSTGGAVEVSLRHDGFADAFADTEGHRMVAGGWHHFLGSLKGWVEDGRGQPFE